MIKFDGYYKLKTVPVKDSIANHTISGYHHMAFLFQKNEILFFVLISI